MSKAVPLWLTDRVRAELELSAIIDWLRCCRGRRWSLARALKFVRVGIDNNNNGYYKLVMRSPAWQVLLCPECGAAAATGEQLDQLFEVVRSRAIARVELTCINNHRILYGDRESDIYYERHYGQDYKI